MCSHIPFEPHEERCPEDEEHKKILTIQTQEHQKNLLKHYLNYLKNYLVDDSGAKLDDKGHGKDLNRDITEQFFAP